MSDQKVVGTASSSAMGRGNFLKMYCLRFMPMRMFSGRQLLPKWWMLTVSSAVLIAPSKKRLGEKYHSGRISSPLNLSQAFARICGSTSCSTFSSLYS